MPLRTLLGCSIQLFVNGSNGNIQDEVVSLRAVFGMLALAIAQYAYRVYPLRNDEVTVVNIMIEDT